jgi:hypothetical protein
MAVSGVVGLAVAGRGVEEAGYVGHATERNRWAMTGNTKAVEGYPCRRTRTDGT